GGKDLRTATNFSIGNAAAAATATVTITSSNPSTVQVAASPTDAGQGSIQVAPNKNSAGAFSGFYYVDCLQDKGGADVTLSSPGYPDQVVRASCFPAAVIMTYPTTPAGAYRSAELSSPLIVSGRPSSFRFSLAVSPPAQTLNVGYVVGVRAGARPIQVQVANS